VPISSSKGERSGIGLELGLVSRGFVRTAAQYVGTGTTYVPSWTSETVCVGVCIGAVSGDGGPV